MIRDREASLNRKEKVLKLLFEAEDYISGEDLSDSFGVSRTTIWKYIKYFRELGYQIDSSSKLGYKLIESPDKLVPEEIKINLKTEKIARKIIYYEQIDSTNSIATLKAKEGLPEGTIIIAEKQSGGRGRMGREFVCPRGGLWFSTILRPEIKPMLATRFTYLFAVAVAEVINEYFDVKAEIKWPNDILVAGKKVCGILTEMSAEIDLINYVVVGVGVNLNFSIDKLPQELHQKATTLFNESDVKVKRVDFLQDLLLKIEDLYGSLNDFETILERWKDLNCTLGNEVSISNRGSSLWGKAVDIASDGALVLELEVDGKKKKVYSGDLNIDS